VSHAVVWVRLPPWKESRPKFYVQVLWFHGQCLEFDTQDTGPFHDETTKRASRDPGHRWKSESATSDGGFCSQTLPIVC